VCRSGKGAGERMGGENLEGDVARFMMFVVILFKLGICGGGGGLCLAWQPGSCDSGALSIC